MKRVIFLSLLILLGANSLTAQRKIGFAVEAGANFNAFIQTLDTGSGKQRARTPFTTTPTVALRAELPIASGEYYLSLGLSYLSMCSDVTLSHALREQLLRLLHMPSSVANMIGLVQERTRADYLSIPLLFGGRARLSRDGKWSITGELGVRFSLGQSGSIDYILQDTRGDEVGSLKLQLFSPGEARVTLPSITAGLRQDALFKSIDLGLQLGTRVEYDRYYFRLGADRGLINLPADPAGGVSTRTYHISTTLGFRF